MERLHPRYHNMPTRDLIKYASIVRDNYTYICKCGHRVVMNNRQTKVLCHWCNHYVYRDKKDEFKERVNELCKRRKNEFM